ncbi:7561_t:CDS:10 [Entrophospora sp. SA101]|nr:7561_t:CDS:10 [Entrophospora sp. SA101]
MDYKTYGGGFMYHMENNIVQVGYVVGLDYQNPYLNPYKEFQKYKLHPYIRKFLEGAKVTCYGARALNEGGYQSIPKSVFPGRALIGCTARFMNVPKEKQAYKALAYKSETSNSSSEPIILDEYEKSIENSWNSYSGLDTLFLKGRVPWTFKHHADWASLKPAKKCKPIEYPKPDGKITFDLLESVSRSGTNHSENQPVRLRLRDEKVPVERNLKIFDAGVYEFVDDETNSDTKKRLQVNSQNCLHCKTCYIKDVSQNVGWVTPEGGNDSKYNKNKNKWKQVGNNNDGDDIAIEKTGICMDWHRYDHYALSITLGNKNISKYFDMKQEDCDGFVLYEVTYNGFRKNTDYYYETEFRRLIKFILDCSLNCWINQFGIVEILNSSLTYSVRELRESRAMLLLARRETMKDAFILLMGHLYENYSRSGKGIIKFYNRDELYYEFTNFYSPMKKILIDVQFENPTIRKRIQYAKSAREVFLFARSCDKEKRADWESAVSEDRKIFNELIMKKALKYGGNGEGLNRLGQLLKEVRSEIFRAELDRLINENDGLRCQYQRWLVRKLQYLNHLNFDGGNNNVKS